MPILSSPAVGVVQVTYRDTEGLGGAVLDADVTLLSVGERARHSRFMFARDRRDFATAHALLRRRLSTHADVLPEAWTFETAPGGKPRLAPSHFGVDLTFNVSHTRGLVACAIGRGAEIGVDVESIDRAVDGRDVVARYFSPGEVDLINACDADEQPTRFIELWTLKEAYIKAVGQGLSHPLDCFGFSLDGERGLCFTAPPGEEASQWTFALFEPSLHYRLAVAVHAPSAVVRVAADGDEGAARRGTVLRATPGWTTGADFMSA